MDRLALGAEQLGPAGAFEVEPWMRPRVEFWKRIYTQYTSAQGLVHDSKHPELIYEIVDATHLNTDGRHDLVQESREKWSRILRSVHEKRNSPSTFDAEEQRVWQLFAKINEPNKFLEASDLRRIRFQLGLKDHFAEYLEQSARYLPSIEKLFAERGLPRELARLPLLESGYNPLAKSSAGAAGMWQFLRDTGKRYIRIDDVVDERYDPQKSTEAAARLLTENYKFFLNWPLAVTAYNHGRMGIHHALEKLGNKLDVRLLLEDYQGPAFGIASRSYYLAFLAAVEVERDRAELFGRLKPAPPLASVQVSLMHYVFATDLCVALGLTLPVLREHNPSLSEAVWGGKRRIPYGFPLKVPADWGKDRGGPTQAFWQGYSRLPERQRFHDQVRDLPAKPKAKSQAKSGKSPPCISSGSRVAQAQARPRSLAAFCRP
ncbi:MAG TPA: lytic transglycosylase domain-containing protein [Bdellovibrionota bacterium]|nr:lytic transglycosylase domain-containing protein [Bdellovibrionota bacterium]